jgi:hypothetical protein
MADAITRPDAGFRTVLRLELSGKCADIGWKLQSELGGQWMFAGEANVDQSLGDLVKSLQTGIEGPDAAASRPWLEGASLPEATLRRLAFIYKAGSSVFAIQSDIDLSLGTELKLRFCFARMNKAGQSNAQEQSVCTVIGVCTRGPIELTAIAGSDSGIIGRFLGDVHLDRLGIYYATDDIDAAADLFQPGDGGQQVLAKGLSFSARFGTPQSYTDLALPPPRAKGADEGGVEAPSAPAAAASTAMLPAKADGPLRYWKDVNKSFGPLQLRRIGGEWDNGKLGILLDAAVELVGLKVGLAGLGVKVPPSKLSKLKFEDLEFGLDGLALDFKRGPVSISGSLLKTRDGDQIAYSGMASIRAEGFSIAAIGSYSTTKDNQPSFFIFGAFTGILAGPPCFVVQGFAAGFGYNRAIALPEVQDVRNFPLVTLVLGESTDSSASMLDLLGSQNSFPPVTGQYWLAAGVKFTSFKLVDAFALITVQFGTRLEIALLGVATLRQPASPAPQPFVQVEMAIKMQFAPDDGVLSVQAVLTENSYLFDKRCRLTGGFAFCVWFKPTNPKIEDHSGDFVITLGGYHPKFKAPSHYPKVPRVGLNWQLPDCGVTIKGEAYYALTPSFIMAGGRLSAIFRSADFCAWFEAHADFLIGWEPFHYDAEIGVRIGAAIVLRVGEITNTLSFELGAVLRIWGPPFAGEAYVDLGTVAFTVPIGDRGAVRSVPALSWEEFAARFLPHAESEPGRACPLSVSITAGIVSERRTAGDDMEVVVVNPSELQLAVDSFIPLTELTPVPAAEAGDTAKRLGIRPMAVHELRSTLHVDCERITENDDRIVAAQEMIYRAVKKSVPEALWSPDALPDAGQMHVLTASVIANALTGVEVLPHACQCTTNVPAAIRLENRRKEVRRPRRPNFRNADYHDRAGNKAFEALRAALRKPGLDADRDRVIESMLAAGFSFPHNAVALKRLSDACDETSVLLAPPWMVHMGDLLPLKHGA